MRTLLEYAYLHEMKARLNLTIDNDLLITIKSIAQKKQTSVSELVEEYFKLIAKPKKRKSIVQLIEGLPKPNINFDGDLNDLYYKDQSEKYGF